MSESTRAFGASGTDDTDSKVDDGAIAVSEDV